jgi:hypothetical protein
MTPGSRETPTESKVKLLDQMRDVMRLKHLSYRTEEATLVGSNALFCFMTNVIPKIWEPQRSVPSCHI